MDIKIFSLRSLKSVKDALKKIDNNHHGCVIICDDQNKVLGIATDGDIRRQLIINQDLNQKIDNCMNINFISVFEDSSHEDIYKKFDSDINILPVLNKKNQLTAVYTKDNIPFRGEVKTSSRAKSPVRISFGGGGSDTTTFFSQFDGAVINATISLYSYASLFKRDDKKILIDSLDLNKKVMLESIENLENLDKEFGLIKAVIKTIKPKFGFDLIINSDFPRGSGLGGSSAICSAIIGCFNEFRIDKWNSYEIAEIAYESERLQLDVAGGWQDQYATVFGGFNFMEFRDSQNLIHPLRLSEDTLSELENNLILCYTNMSHKDDGIHRTQKSNTSKAKVINNIKQNVLLCYKTRNTLLRGELNEFGTLLDDAWQLKKTFSKEISNKYLDNIYNGALKNGATGGKLLGAGGGGFFVFYVKAKEKINFLKWLISQELKHTYFKFVSNGLNTWLTRE
tara:strand:+ start:1966 stop:3324 length:1359 start_codon:yes stop_codon:yes gene_type:complete